MYNYSGGTINLVDTNMIGTVYNNNSNGKINIKKLNNDQITLTSGKIVNKGRMDIKELNMSLSSGDCGTTNYIENTGILSLNSNSITYSNSNSCNNERRVVYNSGTLTSTNNNYKARGTNSSYHYMFGIYNTQIMTSTSDSFEIYDSRRAYAIHNNTSHDTEIDNANIIMHNITEYDYGVLNYNSHILNYHNLIMLFWLLILYLMLLNYYSYFYY